jgi:hypothetical protein
MTVTIFLKEAVKEPHIYDKVLNVSETVNFYRMRQLTEDKKFVDIKIPIENIYRIHEYRESVSQYD